MAMFLTALRLSCIRRGPTSPVRSFRRKRSRVRGTECLEVRSLLSALPAGGEFLVNTSTAGNQHTNEWGQARAVAMDADGNFVVTWYTLTNDGSDVFAQRFNAAGVPLAGEFRVNSTRTKHHTGAQVAVDADGDFVIVWASYQQDGVGWGIFAQRFNAAGVRQGSEFGVNTTTLGQQLDPMVAMNARGDFVITWSGDDGDVYLQRYGAAGVMRGGEVRVNTQLTEVRDVSNVAMDASGNFIVTWTSYDQTADDAGMYAQRFNSAGARQGLAFRVDSQFGTPPFINGWEVAGGVAMDADGNFVVSWSSYGRDGSLYGIYGQRYNAVGVPQGAAFLVNTTTENSQYDSAVAMNAEGDFIITWTGFFQSGGNNADVYVQRYNAAGVRLGDEFRVNTTTMYGQYASSVAIDADGDFVIAYMSYGQNDAGTDIYAQRYVVNGPVHLTAGGILEIVGTNDADVISVYDINLGLGQRQLQVAWNDLLFAFEISAVHSITIVGMEGNDALAVADTIPLPSTLKGGPGDDVLTGGGGSDNLIGDAGDDTLRGSGGNDIYLFDTDVALGSDTIDESGGGFDTLDFGATTTRPVRLNLGVAARQFVNAGLKLTISAKNALEKVIGGSRNDTLTGNSRGNVLTGNAGHDILVGNGGNDRLAGGAGRDILIGGMGSDRLNGGTNDDILIAGRTTNDALIRNLWTLRREWASGIAYATRIQHLRAGVGSPTVSLAKGLNVFDDSHQKDTLTGGSGRDWYFRALDDLITDLWARESMDVF